MSSPRLVISKTENTGTTPTLQEQAQRMLEHFFTGLQLRLTDWDAKTMKAPAANIVETPSGYIVDIEIAGIEPASVDLEAVSGTLTVRGERMRDKDETVEGTAYLCQEISCGAFSRTIALPAAADCDQAKASFKNGLLKVTIPKKPESIVRPKKIDVRTAA